MNNSRKDITQVVESYVGWLNDRGLDFNDVMPVGHAWEDSKIIDHVLDVVRSNSNVSFDMGDPNVRGVVVEVLTAHNFMGDGLYEEKFGAQPLHEARLPASVNLLLESVGEDPYEGPYPETAAEFAEQLNSTRDPSDPFKLATDDEYWAKAGVYSGEDLARYLITADYVDIYKEMYGFKPSLNWEGLTIDQMRDKLNFLLDDYHVEQDDVEYVPAEIQDEVPSTTSRRAPTSDYEDEYESLPARQSMHRRMSNESRSVSLRRKQLMREEFLRDLAYKWEL